MSTTTSGQSYAGSTKGRWAAGGAAFAGIMLVTVSAFQILEGIAALANDSIFVHGLSYSYKVDLTAWGWLHLVLGIIGVATGAGILAAQTWGFLVGIAIAFIGAISSFAFLPYYPFWALVILAFDVFVIWALSSLIAHDRP